MTRNALNKVMIILYIFIQCEIFKLSQIIPKIFNFTDFIGKLLFILSPDFVKDSFMKNIIIRSSILVVVALCIYLYTRSVSNGEYLMISGLAQGTTYNITFRTGKHNITREDTDSLLREFDMSLSVYEPNSIISRFNRNDETVSADDKFSVVFEKSFEVFTTHRRWHLTLPLHRLWMPLDLVPATLCHLTVP